MVTEVRTYLNYPILLNKHTICQQKFDVQNYLILGCVHYLNVKMFLFCPNHMFANCYFNTFVPTQGVARHRNKVVASTLNLKPYFGALALCHLVISPHPLNFNDVLINIGLLSLTTNRLIIPLLCFFTGELIGKGALRILKLSG